VNSDGPDEGIEVNVANKTVEAFYNQLDQSDYCEHIEKYSPKFKRMVDEIQEHTDKLQLVYSQFITIEGLRSFARVLNSRGFAELTLEQGPNGWTIRTPTDPSSRMYIVYSADKEDKKEIYRNIFNQNWDVLPQHIREQARSMNISVFMITAAGSEGISLRNVQYVHIMEPYWNPVRIDQVIGRARRICSHNSLPELDRFVEVNLYLSVLPDVPLPEVIKDDLVKHGHGSRPGSTDEYLYALSQKKRSLSEEILDCIRQASIDCSLYVDKDKKDCLKLLTNDPESISYHPDITLDVTSDKDVVLNTVKSANNTVKSANDTVKSVHTADMTIKLFYNPSKGDNGIYKLYRDDKAEADWVGYYRSEGKKTSFNKEMKITSLSLLYKS
jgi:hypothetical protein